MTKNEVIALGLRYSKWQTAPRYELLYDRAFEARLLDGDIVECGVALGGSAAVLAGAAIRSKPPGKPIQRLFLCDTFTGLPAPVAKDGAKAQGMEGRCAGPVESVTAALREVGYPSASIHIVKGLYQDTLHRIHAPMVEKIALLHIDADWYESTKVCLEQLVPKVVKGGFVIIDDYGFWEGCKTACDEWFAVHGLPKLHSIPDSPQRWWCVG